jgi:hypothetical protein
MRTVRPFDISKHHIYTPLSLVDAAGNEYSLTGVVDTGAPWTELSDEFLIRAGFCAPMAVEVRIKPELQTQKYGKTVLPSIIVCGQPLADFEVMVSRFEPGWGIAALIGLDFFRRFRVIIDYGDATLTCEPL